MLLNIIDGLGVAKVIVVAGLETITAEAGTITATGVAQSLMLADDTRSGWLLQNNGEHSMFINDCGAATAGAGSFEVLPNGTFPPAGYPLSIGGVSILGTAGDAFTLRTW